MVDEAQVGNFSVRWATDVVASFAAKKTWSESEGSEPDHALALDCWSAAREKGAGVVESGMPDGDVVVSPLSRRRPCRAATPTSRPPFARIEEQLRFHERVERVDRRLEMGSGVVAWETDGM